MSSLGRGYDPCHLRTAIKWSSSLPLHPRTPTSSMECRRDGDTDAPRSATQRRGQLRMATQRCERTVGRAAFQVSTWDWLICHWTDDLWLMAFRAAARATPRACLIRGLEISPTLGAPGGLKNRCRKVFFPGQPCKPVSVASERNPRLLRAFDGRIPGHLRESSAYVGAAVSRQSPNHGRVNREWPCPVPRHRTSCELTESEANGRRRPSE